MNFRTLILVINIACYSTYKTYRLNNSFLAGKDDAFIWLIFLSDSFLALWREAIGISANFFPFSFIEI